MSRRWLLLIYTVPTTPSRTRAYVWRELRRKGALLVRDGVAALPESAAARTWASEAAKRIAAGGGTATASRATFGTPDERRLISAFQRERDREYAEIKSSCADLLAHIAREREHAAFSFEEMEEGFQISPVGISTGRYTNPSCSSTLICPHTPVFPV